MKKSWMILGSAVLSLSLTGCGGNDNAGGVNNNEWCECSIKRSKTNCKQSQ